MVYDLDSVIVPFRAPGWDRTTGDLKLGGHLGPLSLFHGAEPPDLGPNSWAGLGFSLADPKPILGPAVSPSTWGNNL